ncbi:MAG TPA: tail fiber domain-containing protein, partial [Psychromonas sp.]
TFTGFKSSSSFYPQCGAIIFTNTSSADGQDPNDLSGDILVEHCEFKIFHPLGSYGRNADPANYYAGDPNNGFKIFTVFAFGPFEADQYENTGRNCTIRDCRIKEGHNAYGFWVWATYNAVFDNLVAESFVTKATEVDTGTILGGGVPFIRHHQFRTEGAKVTNCYFRARPSSERTEAGFEGSGNFIHFVQNIDEDLAKGEYIVANNVITHGGGDPVYTVDTNIILVYAYGNFIYDGNIFDGHDGESNGGTGIFHALGNGSTGGGVGSIVISNNIWGKWSTTNNIQIATGNENGAYNRRFEQVSITNNLSLSQAQYFLFLGSNSTSTYDGVKLLNVSNNIIDGTYSTWDKTSTNSTAIYLKGGTETTDNYVVAHNQIRSKYFGIRDITTNANVNTFGNKFIDVTDHFSQSGIEEIISGHEQGSYSAEFQGSSECQVRVRELSGDKVIRLYAQSANQYLQATDRINFYTDGDNQVVLDDGVFRPAVDGDITLGTGTFKFGQIYSTSGSISTSDERNKQDIAVLEQAELRVATALKGLIKKFKYKSAVADKGDDARTHIGVIAQEVKAAFEAEGLDPFEYGILCLDTWEDQYSYNLDNEEVLTKEAGEEYAIRYDELFAFIIAAL